MHATHWKPIGGSAHSQAVEMHSNFTPRNSAVPAVATPFEFVAQRQVFHEGQTGKGNSSGGFHSIATSFNAELLSTTGMPILRKLFEQRCRADIHPIVFCPATVEIHSGTLFPPVGQELVPLVTWVVASSSFGNPHGETILADHEVQLPLKPE